MKTEHSNKEVYSRIQTKLSQGALETKPFGKEGSPSYWILEKNLVPLARYLKEEEGFTIAIGPTVFEMDRVLVFTYLFKTEKKGEEAPLKILLRVSHEFKGKEMVQHPSIAEVYPSILSTEKEISGFFGVEFNGELFPPQFFTRHEMKFPLRKETSW